MGKISVSFTFGNLKAWFCLFYLVDEFLPKSVNAFSFYFLKKNCCEKLFSSVWITSAVHRNTKFGRQESVKLLNECSHR